MIAFYLIAQMVGAGNLIRLLFGLPYEAAVAIVGGVMLAYVLFGGMIATTWVQIVKAVLLLGGATLLALLVLSRFDYSLLALFSQAAEQYGAGVLAPRQAGQRSDRRGVARPRVDARHGRAPAHPDAVLHRAGRADGANVGRLRDGLHRLLLPADVHPRLRRDGASSGREAITRSTRAATWRRRCWPRRVGGHAVPRLHFGGRVRDDSRRRRRADAVRRGDAVARSVGERRARRPGRSSASSSSLRASPPSLLAMSSIVLGIAFKGQNVAYMVGLAFAIAASANFPALVLSIFWRRLTTAGAQVAA